MEGKLLSKAQNSVPFLSACFSKSNIASVTSLGAEEKESTDSDTGMQTFKVHQKGSCWPQPSEAWTSVCGAGPGPRLRVVLSCRKDDLLPPARSEAAVLCHARSAQTERNVLSPSNRVIHHHGNASSNCCKPPLKTVKQSTIRRSDDGAGSSSRARS